MSDKRVPDDLGDELGGGSSPRLLVVAREPGAASALIPVALRCGASVIGLDHARPIFERAGVPLTGPVTDGDPAVAGEWVQALAPDVVLTGTSRLELVPHDERWWSAARSHGAPVVALLDHWIGYWQRFTRDRRFDTCPDVIAVMDQYAQDQLLSGGCTGPRIVITGHPGMDALITGEIQGHEAARSRWGVSDDRKVVLFVSEPIRADHGAALGYDEADALEILINALQGTDAVLVVKPHPREQSGRLAALLESSTQRSHVETALSGRAAVAGADVVVGMTSVLLLEAALAGRPVLSVQPGSREPWTQHFDTLMTTVDTATEAHAWLERENHLVLGSAQRMERARAAGFDEHATDRVCRLVRALARE